MSRLLVFRGQQPHAEATTASLAMTNNSNQVGYYERISTIAITTRSTLAADNGATRRLIVIKRAMPTLTSVRTAYQEGDYGPPAAEHSGRRDADCKVSALHRTSVNGGLAAAGDVGDEANAHLRLPARRYIPTRLVKPSLL